MKKREKKEKINAKLGNIEAVRNSQSILQRASPPSALRVSDDTTTRKGPGKERILGTPVGNSGTRDVTVRQAST